MEGRGAGTKGLTRAQHLLEKRYKSLGLEPAGTNGYLQPFTVITGAQLKGKNEFVVLTGGEKHELKPKQDFVPFSFSSSGTQCTPPSSSPATASPPTNSITTTTPASTSKTKSWSSFAMSPHPSPRNGKQGMTRHAQLITKAINARNHGAKALVLVNGKLR